MPGFVIVVDTQRDFMLADGALSVAGAQALVGPMTAWLAALQPGEVEGVLFTFDTHEPEIYARSVEAEQFPIHCVRGTAGWTNVVDPHVVDAEIPIWRMEKGVFAMWEEPDLNIVNARDRDAEACPRDCFFDDLRASGVEEVQVIGVAADYCVRWAIEGLLERGFRVSLPDGLTRGISRPMEQVLAQDFAGRPVRIVAPSLA